MASKQNIAWVTCTTCGKHVYATRKDAKTARKRLDYRKGSHLSIFQDAGCNTDQWHLGTMPKGVSRGLYTRSQLGSAAA